MRRQSTNLKVGTFISSIIQQKVVLSWAFLTEWFFFFHLSSELVHEVCRYPERKEFQAFELNWPSCWLANMGADLRIRAVYFNMKICKTRRIALQSTCCCVLGLVFRICNAISFPDFVATSCYGLLYLSCWKLVRTTHVQSTSIVEKHQLSMSRFWTIVSP